MEQIRKIYSKQVTSSRIDYIDAVKGIGIFLVVIGHHLLGSKNIVMWINTFHMPMFFIISGYLSETQQKGKAELPSYILKRAYALLYPYVTFSIINLLWYYFFHQLLEFSADENMLVVFVKTITTFGYHALWFLPTMFIVALVSKWGENNRLFLPCGQITLIVCAGGISWLLTEMMVTRNFFWYCGIYFGRIIIGITFWGIGKYLFRLVNKLNNVCLWCIIIVSLLISLSLYQKLPNINISFSRIGNPLYFFPVACAGSVFCILVCKLTLLGRSSLLHFLGRNSLVIMTMHMDMPIQIAWIIIGGTGLSAILTPRYSSICAIIVEFCLLTGIVFIINTFFPYILCPLDWKGKINAQVQDKV